MADAEAELAESMGRGSGGTRRAARGGGAGGAAAGRPDFDSLSFRITELGGTAELGNALWIAANTKKCPKCKVGADAGVAAALIGFPT